MTIKFMKFEDSANVRWRSEKGGSFVFTPDDMFLLNSIYTCVVLSIACRGLFVSVLATWMVLLSMWKFMSL